jgi:TolA-binding protein
LSGLCDKKAFDEADRYCREHAADASLDVRRRTFYVVERSRCLVRHALVAEEPQADSLWEQARRVVDDFLAGNRIGPRALVLRAQASLVDLGRACRLAELAIVSPSEATATRATASLRQAIRELGRASQDAGELARRADKTRVELNQFRPDEIRSLANQLQFQQARGYRHLAELARHGTPDRADALNQATELLKPLVELSDDQPLAWASRFEAIVASRLAGDVASGRRLLRQAQSASPPGELRPRLRAEEIRLAIAEGNLVAAAALADQERLVDGHSAPELAEAHLEAALAVWRAAHQRNDKEQARRWREKALALADLLGREHGPYWQARGRQRLAGVAIAAPEVDDLSLLSLAAESAYQAGRIDEALAAYDRASKQAATAANSQKAFEFAFLAATVEHQRKNWSAAADRYRAAALRWPDHARAAESHLLAAHDRLQQLKAEKASSWQTYRDLLREHLRLWPHGKTASDAHWRLGRLGEHEKDWQAAIDGYRAVDSADPKAEDALQSTLRAYRGLFDERRAEGRDFRNEAIEAARYFERVAEQASKPEGGLSPGLVDLATLAAAQTWLELPDVGPPAAERILSRYLNGKALPEPMRREARSLLLLSVLSQGDHGDLSSSQQRLDQLRELPADRIYDSLHTICTRLAGTPDAESSAQAQLALVVLEKLQPRLSELSTDQRRRCELWHALALWRCGKTDAAASCFAALIKQYPQDTDVVAAYAQMLSGSQASQSWRQALSLWRQVEGESKPGTAQWFCAKYELARLHHLLGNDRQAARIIRLTELLHPDLGGSEMKGRFDELRKQVGSSG